MAVVALGSVRSSGTTTLAVALAATWPQGRRVLLVELDPAGGTLAGTFGWPAEPSLVSLAAAARRSSDPEAIWAHCHQLPGGEAVLAEPAGAEQARSAAGMLAELLGRLGGLDAHVLVDVGRLDPAVATPALVSRGGRTLLTARPRLADLHALATFLEGGAGDDRLLAERLGLVLVGDGPYPDAEIAEALGVDVLGHVPWDPDGAELLTVLAASDRRLRLSPLVRSARTLAETLALETARTPARVPAPSALPTPGDVLAGSAPPASRARSRLLRPFHTPASVHVASTSAGSGVVANGSPPGGEEVR
ncbi:MAG: hypothetical protein ACYCST_13485 [Acidimicrobiales bacterium]